MSRRVEEVSISRDQDDVIKVMVTDHIHPDDVFQMLAEAEAVSMIDRSEPSTEVDPLVKEEVLRVTDTVGWS